MIRIIYHKGAQYPHSFANLPVMPWITDYFEFEPYDKNKKYDNRTLFINHVLVKDQWAEQLRDQGRKVILDNLWELPEPRKGMFHLTNTLWFWYREHHFNIANNYDQYYPQRDIKYRALIPMNHRRPHRDMLVKDFGERLDNCIWSYQGEPGLPGDGYVINPDGTTYIKDRWFNPMWYNSTNFTVAAESSVTVPFVTEKTFKPISFYHPFMVLSGSGHLEILKSAGFATFDNIFDESYDHEPEVFKKLEIIIENFDNYSGGYDQVTEERIKHNRSLFYDSLEVQKRMYKEIFVPLLEYAESS